MSQKQKAKDIVKTQAKEIGDLRQRYNMLYEEKTGLVEEILQLSGKLSLIEKGSERAGETDSEKEIDVGIVVQHLRDYKSVILQVRAMLERSSGTGEPAGIAYFLSGRHLETKAAEVAGCIEWLDKYQWGD